MKNVTEQHVLLVVGPTASGKTHLSLQLVQFIQAEIVSADSRQVFRYMDIGTAKPSPEDRGLVPHHLINIRNPDEFFSAGEYSRIARQKIDQILAKGRTPVVVGGSGFYIKALVDGIFAGNHRNIILRKKLNQLVDRAGTDVLYNKLMMVDPESGDKIHPNDTKRIIRALEVYELTGIPMSKIQIEETQAAKFNPHFFGLSWPREVLYTRINKRVDQMIESGLVKEVEYLKKSGFGMHHNALNSVGYKEIFSYLDGSSSFEETVDLIKKNSRRFAKKQMTWFRRDSRIQWVELEEPVDWNRIAESIVDCIE